MAATFDDPKYSVWLRNELVLSDQFDPLIDELTAAIHKHRKLPERKDTREVTRKALSVILANLLRAFLRGPNLFVALFLSGNDYRQGPLNPLGVSYRGIERVVGYLSSPSSSLIVVKGGGFFQGRSPSFVTRIRSTAGLADQLLQLIPKELIHQSTHPLTNDTSQGANHHSITYRSVFTQGELPLIRLKGKKKRGKKTPFIEFEETPETKGMRERLGHYNAFLDLQWIDLLVTDEEFLRVVNGTYKGADEPDEFGDIGDTNDRRVDLAFQRQLHRIFNNSSFHQGGRFYGGWWQNIPSRYRKFVTINWAPTKELDFSNMQAAMLYAKVGKPLEGDAYELEGIDPARYRKLIKKTFFKLINAEGIIKAPRTDLLPFGWTWSQLQEALKEKHAPIAKYFNSGIGIQLQRWDSDIAEEVMLTFMERDILVLPVHDSFLVYFSQEEALKEIMATAYRKRMKKEISIKPDPSFIETQLSQKEIDDDELGVKYLEDTIDEFERKEGYTGYRQRKFDFLKDKDEAWLWRFHAK
jgi:hypothetical protein